MPEKLSSTVLDRLVLAKQLLSRYEELCRSTRDKFRFSQGVLCLHDAVELVLLAVGEGIQAEIDQGTKFEGYFTKINEKLKSIGKSTIGYPPNYRKINRLRNDIKHSGALPEPSGVLMDLIYLERTLQALVFEFFERPLSSISFVDSIGNAGIRTSLENARVSIEDGKFTEAAHLLAKARHLAVGHIFVKGPFFFKLAKIPDTKIPKISWEESRDGAQDLFLLKHGIDIFSFRQLTLLLPRAGVNPKTGDLEFESKDYAHEMNWTSDNLRWALDLLSEIAVKMESPGPIELRHEIDCFDFVAEVTSDSATVYDRPRESASDLLRRGEPIVQWEPVIELKKGEVLKGKILRLGDHIPDQFGLTLADDCVPQSGNRFVFGFSCDFSISRIPRS